MSARKPGASRPSRSARPRTCAALTVQAASASAGDSFSCVAASEQHERQALAERAARVEVGGERDGGAGVDEGAPRRHRPAEEERARREQDADDVARRERPHAVRSRRLEVVDRPRAELDRERDRTLLGELVAVEPQREAGVAARLEVAARLGRVERAALEEDVGGLGERRRLGKHLGEGEVEVRVGVAVELRRHRVRPEPRRDAAGGPDRAQRRELGVAVEPVAGLRLERRRAVPEHPPAVAFDDRRGRPSSPAARVARTVERMPPPRACSSS